VFATINQSTVSRLAGPAALIELVLATRDLVQCGVHDLDVVRRCGPPGVRPPFAFTGSHVSAAEWSPFTTIALPLREGMRAAVERLPIASVPAIDERMLDEIDTRLAPMLRAIEARADVRLDAGRTQTIGTHRAHFPAPAGTTARGARLDRAEQRALVRHLVRVGREAVRMAGPPARTRLRRLLRALRTGAAAVRYESDRSLSYSELARLAHRVFCALGDPIIPGLAEHATLASSGASFSPSTRDAPTRLFEWWLRANDDDGPLPFYAVLGGIRHKLVRTGERIEVRAPDGAMRAALEHVDDAPSFWRAIERVQLDATDAALAPTKLGLILALRGRRDVTPALVGPVLTYGAEAERWAASLHARLAERGHHDDADEVARAMRRPILQVTIPTMSILDGLDDEHPLRLPYAFFVHTGEVVLPARRLSAAIEAGARAWKPLRPDGPLDDVDHAARFLARLVASPPPACRAWTSHVEAALFARNELPLGVSPARVTVLVRALDRVLGSPSRSLTERILVGLRAFATVSSEPARLDARLSEVERGRLAVDRTEACSLALPEDPRAHAAFVHAVFTRRRSQLEPLFAAVRAGLLARSVDDELRRARVDGLPDPAVVDAIAAAATAIKREVRDVARADGGSYQQHLRRRALDAFVVRVACHVELQLVGVEQTLKILQEFPPSLALYLLFGERFLQLAIQRATIREI
jgi:hypothetical protein